MSELSALPSSCGGSSSAQEEPDATSTAETSPTLEALWRAPGEDVAIVPGTSDFGPGTVRFTFLVVDGQGRVVTRPTAKMWLADDLKAKQGEREPHRLLEGCLIAAHAIEAARVFIYIRGEYLTEYEILQAAVDEAWKAGVFG